MKQIIFILTLFICSLECYASDTSNEQQREWIGFVKSSSLNMRSGPGSEYKIVERIPNNAKVDLINENHNPSNNEEWVEVFYNGKTGFVSTEYLSIQKNYFNGIIPTTRSIQDSLFFRFRHSCLKAPLFGCGIWA